MKKGKYLCMTINLIAILTLIVGPVTVSNGQRDECSELSARLKQLDAKAKEKNVDLRVLELRDAMRNRMAAVGCTSQGSGANDKPIHVPESEDAVAYTELAEPRYLSPRAFIEKMQPPDIEPEGSCADLSGGWQIKTSEGSQTWEIWQSRMHPRVYGGRKASGHGGDSKMLAALLDGNVLKLQFDTFTDDDRVFGGTYTCTLNPGCQASLAQCRLTFDRNRTGSLDATFKRLGSLQRN